MNDKPHHLVHWVAIGLMLAPLYTSTAGSIKVREDHTEQPEPDHGEYVVPSGFLNANIAMPNASPVSVEVSSYSPAPLNLEWLKPHEHLVVDFDEQPKND